MLPYILPPKQRISGKSIQHHQSMNPMPTDTLSPTLRARLVRYAELRPCTNAFIDARSPGSDKKENFTIIGPGVAENPHQHVHIREPHGFNIGGARQPPGCTNSLHSHLSEEVFIIQQGSWRFFWGEHGDAGEVKVEPGDTISIPIHLFRGFENIGSDVGFMFAVLGRDDPGRVHWAPHVIEKAATYGLVLLENGSLIDTTLGETVPAGGVVVHPATREEIAYIRTPSLSEMQTRVVSRDSIIARSATNTAGLTGAGAIERPIIGSGPSQDGFTTAPIDQSHGFTIRHLALTQGAQIAPHSRDCVEVLLVHRGQATWRNDLGEEVTLASGDTFTIPRGMVRALSADSDCELFVVRGGDDPGCVQRPSLETGVRL
jgi:quercetin dioxygenase-like cupin family protein